MTGNAAYLASLASAASKAGAANRAWQTVRASARFAATHRLAKPCKIRGGSTRAACKWEQTASLHFFCPLDLCSGMARQRRARAPEAAAHARACARCLPGSLEFLLRASGGAPLALCVRAFFVLSCKVRVGLCLIFFCLYLRAKSHSTCKTPYFSQQSTAYEQEPGQCSACCNSLKHLCATSGSPF